MNLLSISAGIISFTWESTLRKNKRSVLTSSKNTRKGRQCVLITSTKKWLRCSEVKLTLVPRWKFCRYCIEAAKKMEESNAEEGEINDEDVDYGNELEKEKFNKLNEN